MDVFELSPAQWILLAVLIWIAFRIGRMTAGPRESPEAREMRRMQEVQSAGEAFAGLPHSAQSDVDRLLMDGKKIEAIRVIREQTGKGLKEAKQAADLRQKQIKG